MIPPAKIQVRFSDLDTLGHVNNSVYLSYFEMARIYYFQNILGQHWDWKRFGVVLARNEIDYKIPVVLLDEPEIQMVTEYIGDKSFGLAYELRVRNTCYAVGKSVLVCFDATTQKTIPIPDEMKTALNKLNKEI